jgi:hypothetical protein
MKEADIEVTSKRIFQQQENQLSGVENYTNGDETGQG